MPRRSSIGEDQLANIVRLIKGGMTQVEVGELYGVHASSVKRALNTLGEHRPKIKPSAWYVSYEQAKPYLEELIARHGGDIRAAAASVELDESWLQKAQSGKRQHVNADLIDRVLMYLGCQHELLDMPEYRIGSKKRVASGQESLL